MFCKCEKGIKSTELDCKTLKIVKVEIICLLHAKQERLSVKQCRHCVFYPWREILEKRKKRKKLS